MARQLHTFQQIANPRSLMKDLVQRFRGDSNAKVTLQNYPQNVQSIAKLFLSGNKTEPFSRQPENFPGFDNAQAYDVSAAVCSAKLQDSSAQVAVGRKIGFTNKTIWEKYRVDKPNWGYLWQSTVAYDPKTIPDYEIDLADSSIRSKIEPEIVLGLVSAPSSLMSDRELLDCVGWAAHGFEIVHSPFPHWDFTLPDTTAVQALHRKLFIDNVTGNGRWQGEEEKLIADLQNFELDLYRDRKLIASGRGSNVLGSPLSALRHLCEILEGQDLHPQLHPGEIITTGTLTDAIDLDCTGEWHSQTRGLELLNGEPHLRIHTKASK